MLFVWQPCWIGTTLHSAPISIGRYLVTMTILVDPPRWPWRDTMWCHLVSDTSFDELHEFAARLGCRRVGFQGDHYDIDVDTRLRAVEFGAKECGSRELVTKIRDAGLRVRPSGFEKWQLATRGDGPLTDELLARMSESGAGHLMPTLDQLAALANSEAIREGCSGWFVLSRAMSSAVVVHGDSTGVVGPGTRTQLGDDAESGVFVREESRGATLVWSVEVVCPSLLSHE